MRRSGREVTARVGRTVTAVRVVAERASADMTLVPPDTWRPVSYGGVGDMGLADSG